MSKHKNKLINTPASENKGNKENLDAGIGRNMKTKKNKKTKKLNTTNENKRNSAKKQTKQKNNEILNNNTHGQNGAEFSEKAKKIEKAVFSIKFYPVAVDEASKNQAYSLLKSEYKGGNDAIRHLIIYMIHDLISTSYELKIMHNYNYFKVKNKESDPNKNRIEVYRAIFNSNTSFEGIVELIEFLGELAETDEGYEATKLLTYYFSRFITLENDLFHILRNSVIHSLSKSNCMSALKSLLKYVEYSDNEKSMHRLSKALIIWRDKLQSKDSRKSIVGVSNPAEIDEFLKKLNRIISVEFGSSHYG